MNQLIETIGIWLIRLALVGAAIYFLAKGEPNYAYGCGLGALITFLFTL